LDKVIHGAKYQYIMQLSLTAMGGTPPNKGKSPKGWNIYRKWILVYWLEPRMGDIFQVL